MKAINTQENNDLNPERAETPQENLRKVTEQAEASRVDEQIEKRKNSVGETVEHQKIRSYPQAGKKNDLESRSKIFARILREIGCEDGAPICCMMRNSIDFFTALWGIKYAGCRALPIESNQPVDQIQSVILDSETEWLIVDRSAKPLLGTEILGHDSLNIAWMDSAELIPENCFPEFVRDNIDHISMYPVYPAPDKKEPVITFHTFDKNRLKKSTFTQKDIEKVISPILESLNIHSDSKIAGLMSCNSPSVLLEIMSLFHCEAPLFLFDPYQKYHGTSFIREINRLKITHLLLNSETIKRLLPQILSGDILSRSVKRMILWEEKLSEEILNGLKTAFPNAMICTVSMDSDKNISIHTANQFTFRLRHSG